MNKRKKGGDEAVIREKAGTLEWIVLTSVPDSLQTNMLPGEGIGGTSCKTHLPWLWQLFLVRGGLTELTEKIQGSFRAKTLTHATGTMNLRKSVHPNVHSPCFRVLFCLYLHAVSCHWWAYSSAWSFETLWVYLSQVHLSLEMDLQTSPRRMPRFLLRRCLAQLWWGRWDLIV